MSNASATERPARRVGTIVLSRMVVPLCFGALAVAQIIGGVDSLPAWLENFAGRFGIDPALVLRVMLAFELTGVCVTLLLDRAARVAAIALLAGACFVLVAEIAATRAAPGLGLRIAMLAAGAVMLWLLSAPGEAAPSSRTTVGQLVCALAGIGAAIAVAAVVPLKSGAEVVGKAHLEGPLTPPKPRTEPARPPEPQEPIVELVRQMPVEQLPHRVYMLEPEMWLMKRVAELEWASYLPDEVLADLTNESGGTRFIVFYRPDSDMCLQVFENFVTRAAPNRAYAIRFPPGAQTTNPEPALVRLPCTNCTLVAMPRGPLWFAELPVLLRVTNGVVSCMARGDAEDEYETCVSEGN